MFSKPKTNPLYKNTFTRKRVFGQLATKFWYKKKEWKGWINVVNPFRVSIVLGTPGSGKSYAVIN